MLSGMKIRYRYTWKEVCFVFLALAQIILAINYCDMTDYATYYREYERIARIGQVSAFYGFEGGYSLVSSLFASIGIPFSVFYGIYIAAVLFFLYRFIWNNLKNKAFCLILFFIFPFINYLQQLRSAAGLVMILNALDDLYKNQNKKGIIRFVCWILIAVSFQVTNIGYAILIVAPFFRYSTQKKWTIAAMLAIPMMAFLFYDVIYNFMSKIAFLNRIMYNLPQERTLSKFSIFNLLIFTILMYLVIYVMRYTHGKLTAKTLFLVKAALLIIMLQVLVCLSDNAYRLAVLGLPLVYVALLRVAYEVKNHGLKWLIYIGLLVFSGVIMFVYWGPVNPAMNKILTEVMWKIRPY